MSAEDSGFVDVIEAHCPQMRVLNATLRRGSYREWIHPEIEIAIPGERAVMEVAYRNVDGMRQTRVTDRQVSIIPAAQPHQVSWEHETDLTVFSLSPAFVSEVAQESAIRCMDLVEQFDANDPMVWHLGRAVRTELRQFRRLERTYLESIAMVLARHVLTTYASTPWLSREYGGLPRYKLRRAIEYIRENIEKDISFRDIATQLQMSPYHFARMFKRATGDAPHQYIMRYRMNRAKELLADTRVPIADVAFEVGYKSQSHFTTCFGRFMGVTPAAFRAGN